jgi:MarR-like DNA-binding transcriptional regulator SgrR of sgrS sRNA
MFLVSEERIHALMERLQAATDVDGCRAELEKMLEITEVLQWRADEGRSCVGSQLLSYLTYEAQMIGQALNALNKGKFADAISILEDYESFMQWRNNSGDRWGTDRREDCTAFEVIPGA